MRSTTTVEEGERLRGVAVGWVMCRGQEKRESRGWGELGRACRPLSVPAAPPAARVTSHMAARPRTQGPEVSTEAGDSEECLAGPWDGLELTHCLQSHGARPHWRPFRFPLRLI